MHRLLRNLGSDSRKLAFEVILNAMDLTISACKSASLHGDRLLIDHALVNARKYYAALIHHSRQHSLDHQSVYELERRSIAIEAQISRLEARSLQIEAGHARAERESVIDSIVSKRAAGKNPIWAQLDMN